MDRLIIADVRSMNINGKAIGHYFAVAENFMEIFQDSCEVCVAGGALYTDKFKKQLIQFDYDTFEEFSAGKNKRNVLCNVRQLFQICKDDTVVLQCSAVATAYVGIVLFKPKVKKLYMIQYNTMGLDSVFKKILYALAKKKIDGIICPKDDIGQAYDRPYCVVPDYIYSGIKKMNIIPYSEKTYDFGMVGIISRDKGVLEVAKKLKNTVFRVLIAGYPQSEEIRTELTDICKDANNIQLTLEYLSEDDYRKSITSSRYCILNYSGAYSEHSSGVVFDIIFCGVPVIGSDCQSLEFIKDYGLGEIIDDIITWEPRKSLDERTYSGYIENIKNYYESHKAYREKLKHFLEV